MKPTRKNCFKKEKTVRHARMRGRMILLAKVVAVSVALVTVSAGFIFVYDCFVQSPQFQAHDINVTGMQRLSQPQVLELADIKPQTNILSLNLTTTRKRLLVDPWIADATVSRQIPSGLRIVIREEQPLALLETEDAQEFMLNVDGRVFKRAAGTEGDKLPRIQGLSLGDLPVSGKPDTEAFKAVMTLLRLTREKNSPLAYADLHRVHMDREIGATVYTGKDNRTIKLGFGHYQEKCRALRHLMARMNSDGRLARSQIIDLFDVNRIVITLTPAGQSGSDQEEV